MTTKPQKIKTLANLEAGECRWPIGDPRHADFHFCGAKQAEGRPYCIEHWTLSFVPSKPRQAAQAAARPLPIVKQAA